MGMVFVPDEMVQQVQSQVQQRMQMGMMMQPVAIQRQPMMQQPVQQEQSGGPDWIRVPSVQQVEHVAVQPGQTAWIMVQNEPVFAVKEASKVGLTSTEYYRFEAFDPSAIQQEASGKTVSPTDYEMLAERVKAIEDEISEAKKRGAITASRKVE